MKLKFLILFSLILNLSAELPQKLKFEKVFPNLSFDRPIGFLVNPLDDKTAYVLGQKGKVWQVNFDHSANAKKTILDISERVGKKNEEGLLDMVFHPEFAKNKRVIVSYTNDLPKENRISSFTLNDKGIDISSEKVHLKVDQPYWNHNGGQVAFGSDGFLYIGMGDGGKANDPHNHGQNLSTLLGTILRIDINKQSDKGYVVPKDNPFVNVKDARPEIWAYGLRNPWRFSFDQKTGILYCGDVGQNRLDEISIIEKGKNYGWRVKEGTLDFQGPKQEGVEYVKPIAEYGRKEGLSVTGGYVYRGKIKELQGVYLYCDYMTNNFWGLRYDGKKVKEKKLLGNYRYNVSSFSQDQQGEVYISSFAESNIFKISGTE